MATKVDSDCGCACGGQRQGNDGSAPAMLAGAFGGIVGVAVAIAVVAVVARHIGPRVMPRVMERMMRDGTIPPAMRECMEKCGCVPVAEPEANPGKPQG